MNLSMKLKRYELMKEHKTLVKSGKFVVARKILYFLDKGNIRLALDDISWECEQVLERCGFHISINPRTGMANCTVHWNA